MHHQPIKCGVLETDVDGFIGKELLGSIISKHHHVEKIICGHIHVTDQYQLERYCNQHGSKYGDAVGTRFDAET